MNLALIAAALLAITTSTTPTPDFLRDRIICPANKGGYTSPTGEAVWKWTRTLPFNGDSRDDYRGKEAPTLAVDPILGDFTVGADIHGHSGGGGGMRAFVDEQTRSFVFCQNVDTASLIGIYQYLRMPYKLPKSDRIIGAFSQRPGIRLVSRCRSARLWPRSNQPTKERLEHAHLRSRNAPQPWQQHDVHRDDDVLVPQWPRRRILSNNRGLKRAPI